jgi:hypothetical protein
VGSRRGCALWGLRTGANGRRLGPRVAPRRRPFAPARRPHNSVASGRVCVLSGTRLLTNADGCWVASACCASHMWLRSCFLAVLTVLSDSIVVLAMSGTGATAATDTNSVLEVDKIAGVDLRKISGTRVCAVSVGTTHLMTGCGFITLQFACEGANCAWAQQNLASMVKADGQPEDFHHCRWKPVNGPREGSLGAWIVSLSTLKDFVKTKVLWARQLVTVGVAGALSLVMNHHVKVRDMQPPPPPPQPPRLRGRLQRSGDASGSDTQCGGLVSGH